MSKYECNYCDIKGYNFNKCVRCSHKICDGCLRDNAVYGAVFEHNDINKYGQIMCNECVIWHGSSNYMVYEFDDAVYVKKMQITKSAKKK